MRERRCVSAAVLLVAAGVLVLSAACGGRREPPIDDPAAIDDLHFDIPDLAPTEWVERFDAGRAFWGYTLVLYQRRVPMLIDMDGRIVHVWPRVRVSARARLGRDGRLLVVAADGLIKVYDWDGKLQWHYRAEHPDLVPHHDAVWAANGNVLVVLQDRTTRDDLLREIDASGRVVWEWQAADHLDSDFPDWRGNAPDPTHINSIRELPANRWFDGGDQRFRPGNLLVSARSLDTVFVIDRATGGVVWRYDQLLDRQHEAEMIPEGQLGEGLILLFNNGLKNRYAYRQSAIVAIDPVAATPVWTYQDPYFFSSVAGSQQALANGNVLITSSQGGRVFEVTPGREIVWQWTPPYLPMRALRYPYDHCPQTAALERPPLAGFPSRRGRPHVDQELHQFAVPGEYDNRMVAGAKQQLLRGDLRCRELVIPPGAVANLAYGLDLERLGEAQLAARFRFFVRPLAGGDEITVLEDAVDSAARPLWRSQWLPVAAEPYSRAELCWDVAVEGSVDHDQAMSIVAVANPRIESTDKPQLPEVIRQRQISAQEEQIREHQLRILGYIN